MDQQLLMLALFDMDMFADSLTNSAKLRMRARVELRYNS
jgi:hypothetical protein